MVNQSGETTIIPLLTCDWSGYCQGKNPTAWLHPNQMIVFLETHELLLQQQLKICHKVNSEAKAVYEGEENFSPVIFNEGKYVHTKQLNASARPQRLFCWPSFRQAFVFTEQSVGCQLICQIPKNLFNFQGITEFYRSLKELTCHQTGHIVFSKSCMIRAACLSECQVLFSKP